MLKDVPEHVADNRTPLADFVAQVTRGARVVITVPAFHCLWSGHDVFLGYKLRHRLPEVKALARSAGPGCVLPHAEALTDA